METIKSFTDVSQSKTLSKILPLESADMCFNIHNNMPPLMTPYSKFKKFFNMEPTPAFLIPCWSLAALMKILHCNGEDIVSLSYGGYKDGEYILNWCLDYEFEDGDYRKTFADNPVDACIEMVIRLNELNLL